MKIKKEYVQAIECILKSLDLYYISIEEIEERLKNLEEDYNDGLCGVKYSSEIKSITNKIHSLTEDMAIINIENREKLLKQLKFMKSKVSQIERQIDRLDEKEREVLQMAYVKGLKWDKISEITNYSRAQCFRIRNEGLEKLAIINYGDRAFEETIMRHIS